MATAAATINNSASPDDGCRLITWAGLAASGDVGDAQSLPSYSEKTWVITGTFTGSPTVALEGSNDGTTWVTLNNKQGSAMTFTAAGIGTSQDRPLFIRPHLTAGTGGASVTVSVAAHKFSYPGRN